VRLPIGCRPDFLEAGAVRTADEFQHDRLLAAAARRVDFADGQPLCDLR